MSWAPSRKRPHCQSCGLPMAGHKRPNGLLQCPVSKDPSSAGTLASAGHNHPNGLLQCPVSKDPSSAGTLASAGHNHPNGLLQCPVSEDCTPAGTLASPPLRASPSLSSLFGPSLSSFSDQNSPRSSPPTPQNTAVQPRSVSPERSIKREPSFREPIFSVPDAHGYRHWRNPNWTDPPVKRPPSPSGSVISTVLIDDDQRTIRGSEYNGNREDDCASVSSAFMEQVTESLKDPRVVSMFPARLSDQALAQQLAAKRGMHAAQVRVPSSANSKATKKLGPAGSWWMVVGRNPALVSRVVDQSSAQRAMPGVMGDLMMEGPRLTTLLELIFTGLIAGIVLLCGLAYL